VLTQCARQTRQIGENNYIDLNKDGDFGARPSNTHDTASRLSAVVEEFEQGVA
jgi:hypothetical protein